MQCQDRPHINARWEAGELGCSQLIIGVQRALSALEPGEHLELVTHDGGAWIDIPAWCYLTGHELVVDDHPTYIIKKQGDRNV